MDMQKAQTNIFCECLFIRSYDYISFVNFRAIINFLIKVQMIGKSYNIKSSKFIIFSLTDLKINLYFSTNSK